MSNSQAEEYAEFQNAGYMGLYGGLTIDDIHERKKLKDNEKILDFMGSTELIANLFRISQTKEENMIDDFVNDDTAIVYKSEKGLFIITGCSHSGICNIIEYAKKICEDNRIYGIIGGFHLFDASKRLDRTIEYLKENSIKWLYPCHCVSLKAKIEMAKQMQINEVGVGLEINI